MRRALNKLTDIAVRQAKPKEKSFKLADGGGLYLEVMPNGSKLWRLKYRLAGKEKRFALGIYPAVSLTKAREDARKARVLIADGIDPVQSAREHQRQQRNSFDLLSEDWMAHNSPRWAESTTEKHRHLFDKDILPFLGKRPVSAITRPELVEVVQRVEKRSAFDVARKVRQGLNQIFRFALAKGLIQYNPATDLDVIALPAPPVKHHPFIPFAEIPALLNAVAAARATILAKLSVRLLLLTGVRPGELRFAPWSEFDLDHALWLIPAKRMKMRRAHQVPLPTQAVEILRELHELTGHQPLLFPWWAGPDRPICENTVNNCLIRAGYKGRQDSHGFRHLLSTELNGRGYHRDWIERQLAHGDSDEIRATYNHATYLDQRRQMMQAWADEIDHLTHGGNVIQVRFSGGT